MCCYRLIGHVCAHTFWFLLMRQQRNSIRCGCNLAFLKYFNFFLYGFSFLIWLRSCCGYEGRQTRRSFNEPTGQMGRQTDRHKSFLAGQRAPRTAGTGKRAPPAQQTHSSQRCTTLPLFLPQARSLHAAADKKKKGPKCRKTQRTETNELLGKRKKSEALSHV